jgi:16S rRNA (cytosine967-C5)-methyltransferase
MARAQAAILAAGARVLRPGGVLVYSTCTISPTENERLIAAFLDSHTGFGLDDLAAEMPALRMVVPAGSTGEPGRPPPPAEPAPGFVLTLPHRDRTAGFFIARLRRS